MAWLKQKLATELAAIHSAKRYRQTKTWQSRRNQLYYRNNRPLINFCSNDYLGLSNHPVVNRALASGVIEYGAGSGSADLVTGHCVAHEKFAAQLAEFVGAEAALLFSSGYIANLTSLDAVADSSTTVFSDELNHASLIDGCRISKANTQRYQHLDFRALGEQLVAGDNNLVVSDTVFSMDGDIAPLPELLNLAEKTASAVFLDDAHGFGVLGQGQGALAHFDLSPSQVDLQTITFGKALGGQGAAVVGSRDMIDFLRNRARGYIFSTATAPAGCSGLSAALGLIAGDIGSGLRQRLQANCEQFRVGLKGLGFDLLPSDSPIHAVVLGSEAAALKFADALAEKGFWVAAIRPPTVAPGTSRLRITLSAEHTDEQIAALLGAMAELQSE